MPRAAKKKPIIIVDTREQMPYAFSPAVETIRLALPTGDYSIGVDLGLGIYSESVCIERKTLADFIGSVIHQRSRFMGEVERMSHIEHKCIVVEGSLSAIFSHQYDSATHPNSIVGSAVAIHTDYGVPVYFLENRQIAENFVERFLTRLWLRYHLQEASNGIITREAIRNDPRESVVDFSEEEYPPWIKR